MIVLWTCQWLQHDEAIIVSDVSFQIIIKQIYGLSSSLPYHCTENCWLNIDGDVRIPESNKMYRLSNYLNPLTVNFCKIWFFVHNIRPLTLIRQKYHESKVIKLNNNNLLYYYLYLCYQFRLTEIFIKKKQY